MTKLGLIVGAVAGAFALAACAGTPVKDDSASSSASASSSPGGIEPVAGFDPESSTIRVGVISTLSGPQAAAGQALLLGTQLYVDRINAEGGVAGKYKVELVSADSAYDPQKATTEYNGMVDDVVLLGQVLGTGVIQALLPQAEADNMLIVPASSSAAWLREPNVLPVMPTYEATIANGLAYAVGHKGPSAKTCALVQDDPFGESVNSGYEHAVAELGVPSEDAVRFPLDTADFTPQISKLKSAGCEIVAFGATAAALPALATAAQLDFAPQWVALAAAVPPNLGESPLIDYVSQNLIVAAAGAEWGDTSVPGMAQLLEDFDAYAPDGTPPSPVFNIAGYTYGIAVGQLLDQAVASGDLSHKSLLDISHSDMTLDFLGLSPAFQYGPVETRQSPSAVTIFSVDASVPGLLKTLQRDFDSPAAQSTKAD